MIKRLLLSLGVITVVGSLAVYGTQALLSDTVTLTANTFSTGTVDLQIWDGDSYEDTSVGFTETMFPGESSDPHAFWLKNNASGVDLSIAAAATVTDNEIDPTLVEVTIVAVDGANTPVGTPVTKLLSDWTTPSALGLPDITTNGEQKYLMTVTFDESIEDAGATSAFDFTFTGTQVLLP